MTLCVPFHMMLLECALLAGSGNAESSSWLVMVPGAFYGVQVIRLSYGEKKMGMGAALLHGFLQFNFLVDVLDAMYLAVKKWGMGKKSSVLIGILYGGAGAGLIWFIAGAVN